MTIFDEIYTSLLGVANEDSALDWVENAFSPGSPCFDANEEIWEARLRLCERLGLEDDRDVQILVDNFYDVQEYLCRKMFLYGIVYSQMIK